MNLQARCTACGEFVYFRERVADRHALAKKLGVKIRLRCIYCNSTKDYSVNDIKAKPNKYLRLIRILFFAAGTPAVLLMAMVSGLLTWVCVRI